MKLYYSPLACSLADHIALLEAGVPFERERVDLKTKRTESGGDFNDVTRKGYVPALVLDSGEILTENIAVLDWLASQYPALGVAGKLGRTRLLESLAFISTEVHRNFKPMWHASSEAQKAPMRRDPQHAQLQLTR
jgi:glutathione S-transferase